MGHLDAAIAASDGRTAASCPSKGVDIAQELEGVLPLCLADHALRGEVSAGDRDVDEPFGGQLRGRRDGLVEHRVVGRGRKGSRLGEQRLGSSVLVREEVDLRQPEGVIRVVCALT